jgi:hypothetical protein
MFMNITYADLEKMMVSYEDEFYMKFNKREKHFMLSFAEWLLPQLLNKHDVMRWMEFEKQMPNLGQKVWVWQKGWERPLIRTIDEHYMQDVERMYWCPFLLPSIA